MRRFGAQIYYGDASRLEILGRRRPARRAPSCWPSTTSKRRCRSREIVRQHYPDVPIYARSRDRMHVHRLMDAGVTIIQRETFLSAWS